MEFLKESIDFEWDPGNQDKNLRKHRVTNVECEEVFFDPHKRLLGGTFHVSRGHREERHILIGRTKADRALFVVFTLRKGNIRVISARDMHRKERGLLP